MATGGTIPSARVETVTFYNTSGVIDREHNVYLSPRFEDYTGTYVVKDKFITILDSVCPPPDQYKAIALSGWSPEDRQLVIKGNIDDFRCNTPNLATNYCLNYCIVKRTITISQVAHTYYYGFFVVSAIQAGGASIRLTLLPDHFTNVYYLFNETSLSTDANKKAFDPFNAVMKNCYVERQHYDRVEKGVSIDLGTIGGVYFKGEKYMKIVDGTTEIEYTIKATVELSTGYRYFLKPITVNYSHSYTVGGNVTVYVEGMAPSGYSSTVLAYSESVALPVINKLFYNQNLDFPYKYQFRKLKYALASNVDGGDNNSSYMTTNFTKREMNLINNTFFIDSSFSSDLKTKILRSCLAYLVIETKSLELIPDYYLLNTNNNHYIRYIFSAGNNEGKNLSGNPVMSINRPNAKIAFPIFLPPKSLSNLSISMSGLKFIIGSNIFDLSNGLEVLWALNKKGLADYIYDAYIVRDINIKSSNISIEYTTSSTYPFTTSVTYRFNVNNSLSIPSATGQYDLYPRAEDYISGLLTSPDYIDNKHTDTNKAIKFDYGTSWTFDSNYPRILYGLMVYDTLPRRLFLDLFDELPLYSQIKTSYYDPVLETEPYKFYSISTLSGYELPLNKNRYYTSYENFVVMNRFMSINGAIKVGIIPQYTVEDYTTDYFNESLTYTINCSLPLSSDSYSTYYYRNKSSMKAQYANMAIQNSANILQAGVGGVTGMKAQLTEDKWSGAGKALSAGLDGDEGSMYASLANTAFSSAGHMFSGAIRTMGNIVNEGIAGGARSWALRNTIEAKKADVGRAPDTLSQAGSDVYYDIKNGELDIFLNQYQIDELSYNSNAKIFERIGYEVGMYDTLHTKDRVGWNFIRLSVFDIVSSYINLEQESAIRQIFSAGVTLLHDKSYLTSGHNYETILDS